jgi:hypothetical protein
MKPRFNMPIVKMCVLCHQRPAAVPDRERMGKPIKRVCRECHAARLRGDLVEILEVERKRRERIMTPAVSALPC